jgi:hypothetical protein
VGNCPNEYFRFPCAGHSDEPLNAENVFASGLHDFLSFISIAQKETFHISFVRLCGRLLKKFNRTIQNKNDLIQQTDSEVFTNIKI